VPERLGPTHGLDHHDIAPCGSHSRRRRVGVRSSTGSRHHREIVGNPQEPVGLTMAMEQEFLAIDPAALHRIAGLLFGRAAMLADFSVYPPDKC
jgi:hypothetical protein